jgi:hypothetical protein
MTTLVADIRLAFGSPKEPRGRTAWSFDLLGIGAATAIFSVANAFYLNRFL